MREQKSREEAERTKSEAERQACEKRLRAERRAGELLRAREKAKGAQSAPGKKGFQRQSDGPTTTAPTLSDLGISKQQSSNWQKLAAVPEQTFEQELAQQERPTTSGIIRAAEPPKTKAKRFQVIP